MPATRCDCCGRPLAPHGHYVVRIEVFADPSTPDLTTHEENEPDSHLTLAQLMTELKESTTEELQNQIYRRFEFAICPACQPKFLANPLGLPRNAVQLSKAGQN